MARQAEVGSGANLADRSYGLNGDRVCRLHRQLAGFGRGALGFWMVEARNVDGVWARILEVAVVAPSIPRAQLRSSDGLSGSSSPSVGHVPAREPATCVCSSSFKRLIKSTHRSGKGSATIASKYARSSLHRRRRGADRFCSMIASAWHDPPYAGTLGFSFGSEPSGHEHKLSR